MTDRELLELAAKACGYDTSHRWNAERLLLNPPVDALVIDGVSTGWNPLTDDGDALRLVVKLEIELSSSYDAGENAYAGYIVSDDMKYVIESKGKCPYAATRRAIVRAAAEIGKAMP